MKRPLYAFTVLEMLASMVLLLLLSGVLYALVSQTSALWQHTKGQMEQFREARTALETITQRVAQATLNTYWDYYDDAGNRVSAIGPVAPSTYNRFSELHFLSGPIGSAINLGPGHFTTHGIFFQAPIGYTQALDLKGMNDLLNVCGFFVEYGGDGGWRPPFITWPERKRYRLIEVLEPAEAMGVYGSGGGEWIESSLMSGNRRVLAENIVALILQPMRGDASGPALSPGYRYDSRDTASALGEWFHQLPPLMNVALVAIDEASASRLDTNLNPPLDIPLFSIVDEKRSDMEKLEAELVSRGLNYRIFETTIPLRAAKWSNTQ